MSRIIIGCLTVAIIATACGSTTSTASATATPAQQSLVDPAFRAQFPVTWTKGTKTIGGAFQYQLSSHGTLSEAGIPGSGGIGITVQALPFSELRAHGAPDPTTLTPTQLVGGLIGTPSGATNLVATQGMHAVTLSGDAASGLIYTYSVAGTPNVQEDIVDRHGTSVYIVELDVAPALQHDGEAALVTFLSSWTWVS